MAFAAVSLAQYLPTPQPSYGGPNAVINVDNSAARNTIETDSGLPNAIHQEEYYEWEGYDGWYNNPAHPEWAAELVSCSCCWGVFVVVVIFIIIIIFGFFVCLFVFIYIYIFFFRGLM